MTQQELTNILNYLSDSDREILIEAEMHPRVRNNFVNEYQQKTNNYPLPTRSDTLPYLVLPQDSNKYGLELRAYFVSDGNIPPELDSILLDNNRPGYEKFDKRFNNNEVIYFLFENGFILGKQDYTRI